MATNHGKVTVLAPDLDKAWDIAFRCDVDGFGRIQEDKIKKVVNRGVVYYDRCRDAKEWQDLNQIGRFDHMAWT